MKGEKGNPEKVQIRTAFEEWVKYYNPTANEVQAKENVKAYINPETDKASSGFVPKGKDGSSFSYVVGTEKYATCYLQRCSRIRIYYTGTGGASKAVYVTVVNLDTEEQASYEGDAAPGKNVASAFFEATLSPEHRYAVKIKGTTGDMLVYALKLWQGETSGIYSVTTGDDASSAIYDLSGRRVSNNAMGIIVRGNRKMVNKR